VIRPSGGYTRAGGGDITIDEVDLVAELLVDACERT
jgi:hypothetical protein